MNVSNSACVKSSNSVRRPKSKDTKSKNRLLKNTNDNSSFAHDRKMSSSDSIDSNKRETMNSTNLVGDDLLTGSRESNLYTISISKLAASSLVCLMSKATSTKSWLWHQRLSHLNFGTINQLTSKDLVDGLSKFKYNKDHLCSACEQGKSKKASFPLKLVPSTVSKLELLHMDLCGPMRVVNEAPDMIINFINQVQHNEKAQILKIRTDNVTEFKNEKLRSSYAKLGIVHHTSISRTPQQNGVVERRNHTLVKAVLIMFIFLKTPEFLWPEAIATAFFTQNLSIVHTRYNKTPYELIRGRKPNVQYFHVLGSLCYLTNNRDDLGKIKPKADIVIASECNNLGPSLNCLNFQDSLHEMNEIPSHQDLDNLFGPLYEEYYALSTSKESNNSTTNTLDVENTPLSSSIIVEDGDALQIVTSSVELTTQESSTLVLETHFDEKIQEDVTELDGNTIMHSFDILEFGEAESSSNYQDPSNMHEALLDHSWIESMQDELNQFKRLDVWELVPLPEGRLAIKMKFFLRHQIHQSPHGIFINQSQYTIELLRKHEMEKCDTITTLIATAKIDADLQGTPTDQTKYRSIIGELMYLTTSRPDIAFATFDYGFKLVTYSDADLAGCLDDYKNTSGGLQFLGDKL
ncbi:retrovirus-related pol polyprotein from transposon TNT 1-94, partial [Tanacetum coccineum]